jgi:hypothetical protein
MMISFSTAQLGGSGRPCAVQHLVTKERQQMLSRVLSANEDDFLTKGWAARRPPTVSPAAPMEAFPSGPGGKLSW